MRPGTCDGAGAVFDEADLSDELDFSVLSELSDDFAWRPAEAFDFASLW